MHEDVVMQLKYIRLNIPMGKVEYPVSKALEAFAKGDQLVGYFWCGALCNVLINIVLVHQTKGVAQMQELLMKKLKVSLDQTEGGCYNG